MVQVRIIGHLYSQLAIPYEIAEHPSIRLAPRIFASERDESLMHSISKAAQAQVLLKRRELQVAVVVQKHRIQETNLKIKGAV